jgi:hypothetical protein
MMRYWIGTALLAGSWLLGLDYFYPANPHAWLAAVAAAVVLLGRPAEPLAASQTSRKLPAWAIVLLLPAVWFAAWPYRAAPLLIVLGLALQMLPAQKRWLRWIAAGAVTAGIAMLVQAIVLEAYTAHTAHSHDLPWPLPDLLAGIANLLGINAAVDRPYVVLYSMRQVHRLAATWELLLDPATLLFFFGGLTMLACSMGRTPVKAATDKPSTPHQTAWRSLLSDFRCLTLIVVAWLPVRAGLMMALYMQRVVRADADRPLHTMNHFFSPWVLLLLLIVPVLLAWRFVRRAGHFSAQSTSPKQLGTEVPSPGSRSQPSAARAASGAEARPSPFLVHHSFVAAAVLVALAVALFTAAVYWCPCGGRKGGRVMFVERHSKWEPTTKEYDTKWYVEPEMFPDVNSGYNYARVYRYLAQYYKMDRLFETDKIDDATLAECDVLIVKTPTERYSEDEVKAVLRFVENGGGLLLIGDHTNYERSSTIMNDLIRPMGFIYRDDLLWSFNASPYDQSYVKPPVPHPAVQHMPPMDFAVSCSIDPGHSSGRPVIENTGLWSMGPEYHYSNFLPFPQHCPAMRYGAFVQTWAATYKQGRAMAFTDSTIFSNFAAGQPGKSELLLGMVEWLNHGNAWLDPRWWLALAGLVPAVVALRMAVNRSRTEWLVLLAAGTCGWVVASLAVIGLHRWQVPEPGYIKSPERCVVIDRTTSDVPLSNGAFTKGDGVGYGLFEQWLARLNCRTIRKQGGDAFTGDVLVAICPSRSVPDDFRRQLEQYVSNGGRLLVLDSPENVGSTANTLLSPFGLAVRHNLASKGELKATIKLPRVNVDAACEIIGGQPIARLDSTNVAAVATHGKGSVMVIGFGSLWNDTRMGDNWMTEPDAATKARFDTLYGLIRPLFEGKPWPAFSSPAAPEKDTGPKESGPAEL